MGEDCILKDLDPKLPRRMVVLDPLKVVIEDYPEDKVEEVEAANHPANPDMGTRKMKFSREVWIERADFQEDAPDSYFRLKPGGEVKLRYAYVIKTKEVIKDASGNITELRCTHDPSTRDTLPTDRKVKGVIHWVSAKHAVNHKVRLYSYLLPPETVAPEDAAPEEDEQEELDVVAEVDAEAKMKAFLAQVNPNSLTELTNAKLEGSLSDAKPFDRFQFERNGFFVVDKYSTPGGPLVFNLTIGLTANVEKTKEKVE